MYNTGFLASNKCICNLIRFSFFNFYICLTWNTIIFLKKLFASQLNLKVFHLLPLSHVLFYIFFLIFLQICFVKYRSFYTNSMFFSIWEEIYILWFTEKETHLYSISVYPLWAFQVFFTQPHQRAKFAIYIYICIYNSTTHGWALLQLNVT